MNEETFLATLGVAFAALCIWLTVRIINRRERWAKWTLAAAVGLPVLYVLSFGPACRFVSERLLNFERRLAQGAEWEPIPHPTDWMMSFYGPLGQISSNEGRPIFAPTKWYVAVWTPRQESDGLKHCIMPLPGNGWVTWIE